MVGSILYELIQCVKGICIHFLIYLVINFVSLIQKHTIISKRKHLLHFTTKVLSIKVLWWAVFKLENLRFGLELVTKELNYFVGDRVVFPRLGIGDRQVADKFLFMRYLSMSPMPNLEESLDPTKVI